MDQVKSHERPAEPAAMDELARDPASRKRFLKMVGGAGAASAFAVFLAACGGDDEEESGGGSAQTDTQMQGGGRQSDIEIVNYALTLEFLEADFYAKVVEADLLSGALLDTAKKIGENEEEHVTALTSTVERLGGKPAEKPKTKFPHDNKNAVLELAATVQNLGAAAYLGQAGRIKDKEVLAAALSIHSVEARHAAALNSVVGRSIVPDGAFAKPASMDEVLAEVQPFIAS